MIDIHDLIIRLAKTCWKPFKELPNYKDMLETFSALQSTEYCSVTLQQRRRTFDHEVKRVEKMVCSAFHCFGVLY
jgi:hypothetical protein